MNEPDWTIRRLITASLCEAAKRYAAFLEVRADLPSGPMRRLAVLMCRQARDEFMIEWRLCPHEWVGPGIGVAEDMSPIKWLADHWWGET